MIFLKQIRLCHPPAPSHSWLPISFQITSQVTTPTRPYMPILFSNVLSYSAPVTLASLRFLSLATCIPSSRSLHYTGECFSSQILMAHALILMKVLLKCHLCKAFSDHLTLSFSLFLTFWAL